LTAWSLSTVQFFVFVPHLEDSEKDPFTAHISNSLLSALLMDLPYFGVRMAAIFGFGSHNYSSYFFATKNFVMIMLQLFRIRASFSERAVREEKRAKTLSRHVGFDKEANKLFEPNEIAKRNFLAQQRTKSGASTPAAEMMSRSMNNSMVDGLDDVTNFNGDARKDSFDNIDEVTSPTRLPRLPRSIESIKTSRQYEGGGNENTYVNLSNNELNRPDFFEEDELDRRHQQYQQQQLQLHQQQQHQKKRRQRSQEQPHQYSQEHQHHHHQHQRQHPSQHQQQQQQRTPRQGRQKTNASEQKLNFIKSQLPRPTEFMPDPSVQDGSRSNLYSQNFNNVLQQSPSYSNNNNNNSRRNNNY
jgi:hypothetical protein